MKIDYSPAEPASIRSAHRIILITALCVVGAAMLISRESAAKRRAPLPAEFAIAAPPEASQYEQALQAALADSLQVPEASDWRVVTVRGGQSLSNIFDAEGLAPEEWIALLKLGGDCLELKRLNVGDQLHLRKNGDRLDELRYELDELRTLQVRRAADGFEMHTLTAALERGQKIASGTIRSSLFVDGQKAGLSDRLILELAALFGYDIDFALDLREGDRFSVIYEELQRDGRRIRDGEILAAEFINQKRGYRALRHVDADGQVAYYTPEGQSLKKAFLRTPIEFARISSHFNLRRRHPILNTIRAHKGVDYAAGSGTPIRAVGDGKVTFLGVKGGYGKVVLLQHGSQYETLYAHMSRYRPGLSSGSRVKQGQVIGYVGATGLATAPHLHYEFRVGGVHQNPVTVPLPRANPVPASQMAQFKARSAQWIAQLDQGGATAVADGGGPRPIGDSLLGAAAR